MSQHDLDISNQTFPATRTDLNNALQALGSLQSGTSAPSATFANMLWYDTTNDVLKLRNEADDAWIDVFDVNQTNDVIELISKLKSVDGSASAPSITFDSDTDTGFYRKAANKIALVAGGFEVMTGTHDGTDFTITMGDWTIYQTSDDLYFSHGGTDRMKLDSTGGLTIY